MMRFRHRSSTSDLTPHPSAIARLSKPQAVFAPYSDGATSDAIGFAEPAHALHSSCKHGSALAKSQPSAIRVLGTHGSR